MRFWWGWNGKRSWHLAETSFLKSSWKKKMRNYLRTLNRGVKGQTMLGRWLWLLWAGRTGKEIRGDFRWGLHQWSKLRHWPRKCPRDAKVVKMGTDYRQGYYAGPALTNFFLQKYLPSASQVPTWNGGQGTTPISGPGLLPDLSSLPPWILEPKWLPSFG